MTDLDKVKQRVRPPATPKKAFYQETTDHLTRETRGLLHEVDRGNAKRAAEKAERDAAPQSDESIEKDGQDKQ